MKNLITLICILFTMSLFSQDCSYFPSDTVICGYSAHLDFIDDGNVEIDCIDGKVVSIHNMADSLLIHFSDCGDYQLLYDDENGCLDTLNISVTDPSTSSTNVTTDISLAYGAIDCPAGVTVDCFSGGAVTFDLPGIADPVWSFCTQASCTSTIYGCSTIGDTLDCMVDSISCQSVTTQESSNLGCTETDQFSFIGINAEGDGVDQNTFLNYLAQLQASLDLDCPLAESSCGFITQFEDSCIDSILLDTSYLAIPVRLGGQWTLPLIPELILGDSTYFNYIGVDYELILDPSVTFYGPGQLSVILNEVSITSDNDTIRDFPYGFQLELLWVEDWILDSIEIIREIPIDTTGDCFTCGGNFFNRNFNVPGIPSFPCGPLTIDFPDICECEKVYPDLAYQSLGCYPKSWMIEVTSGDAYIDFVSGADYDLSGDQVILTSPTQTVVEIGVSDYNGCLSFYTYDLEDVIDEIIIENQGPSVLNCIETSTQLSAYGINSGTNFPFLNDPYWTLPNGGSATGASVTATEEGDYTVNYSDNSGCNYSASYFISYENIQVIEDLDVILCGDEITYVEGVEINSAGTFIIDVDCTLSIHVNAEQYNIEAQDEYFSVCEGEVITYDGVTYSAGYHTVGIDNGLPCPSITNLIVDEVVFNAEVQVDQDCDGIATFSLSHDAVMMSDVIIYRDGVPVSELAVSGSSTVMYGEPGLYDIVFDVQGCTHTETIEVEVAPNYPDVDVPDAVSINCDPTDLDIEAVADLDYEWQLPSGDVIGLYDLDFAESGYYVLNVTNNDGCTIQSEVFVDIIAPMSVSYITERACEDENNGTLTLDVIMGGVAPYTILVDGEEVPADSIYVSGGQHTLSLIQADGCTYQEAFFVETQLDLEILDEKLLEFCDPRGVSVNLNGEAPIQYQWLDGHDELERTFNIEGEYDLLVYDECSEGITTFIVQDRQIDEPFIVPNIIRRGSAVGNDVMTVTPLIEFSDYRLSIFSRDGGRVYISDDILSPWDGKINGSSVVSGVYVWMIEAQIITCVGTEEYKMQSGTVTVID